jgi:hypothetical protein
MAFITAMCSHDAKGTDVYTEGILGEPSLTFFTQLSRGLPQEEIDSYVQRIIDSENPEAMNDMIVMAFQTRDVCGKGERDLFYGIIHAFCKKSVNFPVELIPEYGCWRDMWPLWIENPEIRSRIDALVVSQFLKDQESDRPSLLAKWLPREKSKWGSLVPHLANLLFPLTQIRGRLKAYRKAVASLTRISNVVEVKMCSNRWSTINPAHVPGRPQAPSPTEPWPPPNPSLHLLANFWSHPNHCGQSRTTRRASKCCL